MVDASESESSPGAEGFQNKVVYRPEPTACRARSKPPSIEPGGCIYSDSQIRSIDLHCAGSSNPLTEPDRTVSG